MRTLYLFVLFLCTLYALPSTCQVRKISGRLTSSEDGTPLSGISISIKGTAHGTVTDSNGYYSIDAPIGSTLVFSFIGMKTREIIVTEDNLQSAPNKPKKKKTDTGSPLPRSIYQDTVSKSKLGVFVLSDKSPSYKSEGIPDPTAIRSIRKFGNKYIIRTDNDPVPTGIAFQLTNSLNIEWVNKLPSLQHDYAQGKSHAGSLQWFGADQQELFSWGPRIKNLEYDGNNYPFDKNGALVPLGTGNGKKAKTYDAATFFRPGLTTTNELIVTLPALRKSTVLINLEHKNRTGIIPNSDYRKINASAGLRNFQVSEKITANVNVTFNRSTGSLLNHGANLASIIGGVYRTPVTFDNANGLSSKVALESRESYSLNDGTKRSHAPSLTDNPFGLVNELPDHDKLHRLITMVNVNFDSKGLFNFVFNANADQQWNKSQFGTPLGYSGYTNGRLTQRNDNQTFLASQITGSYQPELIDGELKLMLAHAFEYTNRKLSRTDGFNFSSQESFDNVRGAQSIATREKSLDRISQEIIVRAQYNYNEIVRANFTNRTYFSNTVNYSQFTNLFPAASLTIDLTDLFYDYFFDKFSFYATSSRTLREAPLLYSNWAFESTSLKVENYTGFYERNELFFNSSLAPETERKFETGANISAYNQFSFDIAYFNNLTSDFMAPVITGVGVELRNAARVKNYGGNITAEYTQNINYASSWGIRLIWGKYQNKVTELTSSQSRIPLAGLQSAQTVLAKNKPVGAIYGTTYLRDDRERKIIGNDGFPIKDPDLKMIGNPIPDWTLGLLSHLQLHKFRVSLVLEYKHGGENWNGTRAVLDYLGRSRLTGKLRNRTDYIFKGVNNNGGANTIPVAFYDPNAPVTSNRWVRYGWDGVGEDYIEDTSWFRLREIMLSYTLLQNNSGNKVREIKLSLIGRNLLLITPYSGVDPTSTLFGTSTGSGLDLFNLPSTRSLSAQLTLKI